MTTNANATTRAARLAAGGLGLLLSVAAVALPVGFARYGPAGSIEDLYDRAAESGCADATCKACRIEADWLARNPGRRSGELAEAAEFDLPVALGVSGPSAPTAAE
jgi:hypothetical protein